MGALVKSYNGFDVRFNEAGWLNATHLAEKYGKRLDHWLASDETRKYVAALQAKYPKDGDLIRTRRGNGGGTWLHPKLAVRFGQWLDPAFAVWCDMQIDDIVRGKATVVQIKQHGHDVTTLMTVVEGTVRILSGIPGVKMDVLGAHSIALIEQQTGVSLQSMRLALPSRATSDVPMNVTTLAKKAGVKSARAMNQLLADVGLQYHDGERWVPTKQGEIYCDQVPFENTDNGHTGWQLMWKESVIKEALTT